jgi:hypothetical protein
MSNREITRARSYHRHWSRGIHIRRVVVFRPAPGDHPANVTVMPQQPSPDQVIANDAFDAYKSANYPKLSRGEAFERFAISQVALRRFNLSPSEVATGIVGDTNDGGIDGFFIFLNGQEFVEAGSIRFTNRKNALAGLQRGVRLDMRNRACRGRPQLGHECDPEDSERSRSDPHSQPYGCFPSRLSMQRRGG